MKAKEYAEKANAEMKAGVEPSKAVGPLAVAVVQDMYNITKTRKVHSPEALLAVYREGRDKWRAICDRLDLPKGLGDHLAKQFEEYVKLISPQLAELVASAVVLVPIRQKRG